MNIHYMRLILFSSILFLSTDLLAAASGQDLVKQGYEMYKNKNYALAKQLAMQALSLNSRDINAYILLGDTEYMDQHMQAAKKAWQQAANLAPGNKQIQARLEKVSREAETEAGMSTNYDLFFNIKVNGDLSTLTDFDINQALTNARILVSRDFNYIQRGKIPVVIYSYMQYQDSLRDAPQWSEGAYDGKIRIILSAERKNYNQVKSTIIHEYTHAVIADITKNRCPRWFNEGIAKYEEYKHGVKPLINVLALAYNTKTILPWDEIDQAFASSETSTILLAYQQSYSFVYFIVEKYGIFKLRYLLKELAQTADFNTAFNKVYAIPFDTAQKLWRSWLTNFVQTWAEENVQ